MDFFSAQDNARRKTWQLIALFVIAIAALAVAANALIGFGLIFLTFNSTGAIPAAFDPWANWPLVTGAVVGLVVIASAYKYLQLQGGGRAVAEALGGRPLTHHAADRGGRRVLNVVEEMAIASGMPVPPVYVLPEASINAFAAGFNREDAVVGVTQGTIDHLNRAELQGVIAHEFSHIINTDTRLNIRLIAILHGLLCLGIVGYYLVRAGGYDKRNRAAPLMIIGLACVVIGYAGTFFGNLIKAAVSRQREYLADASAVQFTRNPDGIGNALQKIGALSYGSRLDTERASEASHMFFGQAVDLFMGGLLSTHPPLEKRIRAVQPSWDGRFPALNVPHGASLGDSGAAVDSAASLELGASIASAAGASGFAAAPRAAVAPAEALESVGSLSYASIDRARQLLDSLDEAAQAAAHDDFAARALVYAMLLSEQPKLRKRQRRFLNTNAEPGVPELIQDLADRIERSTRVQRISLLQMAMPSLRSLSRSQYTRFRTNINALIRFDGRVDLFEWVLHRVLTQELTPSFERLPQSRVRHKRIEDVRDAAAVLLSVMAAEGHSGSIRDAIAAYRTGLNELGLSLPMHQVSSGARIAALNRALKTLNGLTPLRKPALLKACIAAAQHDGRVEDREAALLQGIAAALDCPLPATVFQ